MKDRLEPTELFEGLDEDEVARLREIAQPRSLKAGEYLFLLGDTANCLYLVQRGKLELCFPFSFGGVVKDVSIESIGPGRSLGWSSFVRPYRLTLSARAVEPSEVAGLFRSDLTALFEEAPRIGYVLIRRLSEIIGRRLLSLQALWARELQRSVAIGLGPSDVPGPAPTPD